jgi:hypothetical protein
MLSCLGQLQLTKEKTMSDNQKISDQMKIVAELKLEKANLKTINPDDVIHHIERLYMMNTFKGEMSIWNSIYFMNRFKTEDKKEAGDIDKERAAEVSKSLGFKICTGTYEKVRKACGFHSRNNSLMSGAILATKHKKNGVQTAPQAKEAFLKEVDKLIQKGYDIFGKTIGTYPDVTFSSFGSKKEAIEASMEHFDLLAKKIDYFENEYKRENAKLKELKEAAKSNPEPVTPKEPVSNKPITKKAKSMVIEKLLDLKERWGHLTWAIKESGVKVDSGYLEKAILDMNLDDMDLDELE